MFHNIVDKVMLCRDCKDAWVNGLPCPGDDPKGHYPRVPAKHFVPASGSTPRNCYGCGRES